VLAGASAGDGDDGGVVRPGPLVHGVFNVVIALVIWSMLLYYAVTVSYQYLVLAIVGANAARALKTGVDKIEQWDRTRKVYPPKERQP
jgi:hypothetical protein